ncbi:MAG TPA: hypothetical protein PLD23_06975 [Armatimonadota bacterium]|nr:hypothetical protein [Armatimonadota bacterium]HQK93229.1 hypothetical protein [Armatimonadota bacterium]
MLRPEPRVRPETTITTRRRRIPEAVELSEQTEQQFRAAIAEFENLPLFRALRERGYLAKIGLRGRIPRERYDEYLDVEMVRIIREHGICDVPGWLEELAQPQAYEQPQRYAAKYRIDAPMVRRVARYCHRLMAQDGATASRGVGAPEVLEVADTAAAPAESAPEDTTALCAAFVERYGLGPEEFTEGFLSGDADAAALARRFNAPLAEVRRVLQAIDSLRILDVYAGSTQPATTPAEGAPVGEPCAVRVASVEPDPVTGVPRLRIDDDSAYAEAYRLSAQGHQALFELAGDEREAEQLLARLRLINQRKSLLHRVLGVLVARQMRYFVDGDPLSLVPFTQADLARAVGEHQSTISRILQRKLLGFRGEDRPLAWYCQPKRDVVARVVERWPDLSDREVAAVLRDRYDCRVSRRTVNYHRSRTKGTMRNA